jgi:hypothetical protein
MATWRKMKKQLINDLNQLKKGATDWIYLRDIEMPTLIYASIPTSHRELVGLLMQQPGFAYVDNLNDINNAGQINAYKIIWSSIYESLLEIAYEWLIGARKEGDKLLAV